MSGFGRRVSTTQLLDLLLLVAATARTLFAVVTRHFPFSHETARHHLPTADVLRERLTDAQHAVADFTRQDRRRHWTVALDLHYVPFYGDRTATGVMGGPTKAGTHFFHTSATAVLLHRRRRYTVGLTPVEWGTPLDTIVATLLDQIAARGLTVGGVALDAGLDSGDTLLLAQGRGLSYVVPCGGRGAGGTGGTTASPTEWHGGDGGVANGDGRTGGEYASAGVAAGGGGEAAGVRVRGVGPWDGGAAGVTRPPAVP